MTPKNQVYVCGTVYHLLLSVLKTMETRGTGAKSLLLINDFTPLLVGLIPDLRRSGLFEDVVHVPFSTVIYLDHKTSGVSRKLFRNASLIRSVEKYFDVHKYAAFIESAEINLFFSLGMSSAYFILKFGHLYIRMLEDGERNYFTRLGPMKIWRRRTLLRTFVGEGNDHAVREIHVQSPDRLVQRVRHKGVKLDLRAMVNRLSQSDREVLIDLFLGDTHVDVCGEGNLLVITQPLSEDRFISEEQKIDLYRVIVEKFGVGKTVYVKQHPRELTDYSTCLGRPVSVINSGFPLELLDLLPNVGFDTGVTIYSSALHNCQCIKDKIFLGMHYDKRLIQKPRFL